MKKISAGLCSIVQNAIEGRTPHYRVQAERAVKVETQIQVRSA